MSNDAPITPAVAAFLFPALVPTRPVFAWLTQLDTALAERGTASFGRALVLDLTVAGIGVPGARALLAALAERGLRVVGLAGLDPSAPGADAADLPPLVAGAAASAPAEPAPPTVESRVVSGTVRSGQRVECAGDLTIVGAVASGAEVVAGGSVHVLGALRGRAVAGGHVFCRRLEAELISIGGAMLLADDIPEALRGRAAHAWAEGGAVVVGAVE